MAGWIKAGRLRRASLTSVLPKTSGSFNLSAPVEGRPRFAPAEGRPRFAPAGWSHPAVWLILILLLTGCAPQVMVGREVRVRVADGSAGLAGLSRVVITFHDVALHQAGQPRDSGWVELELAATPTVELGAAGRGGLVVAQGRVPVGPYDRVRVEVAEVYGEQAGQRVAVRNIVEPIYFDNLLQGGPAELRVDIIVLPLQSGPEPYAVYTRAVQVN